jgi:ABC transporter substrate binding protein
MTTCIGRRDFITLLGGGAAVAWPRAARGQQAERMRRVGVLSNFAESDPEAQSMVDALHQTLQELGWVEGRNLRIDRRWAAGNPTRLQAFAKALIALQPDVIVGHVTPAVIALRKETSTIPIVFIQVSDPIGAGFIANLAHPGGSITGFHHLRTFDGGQMGGNAQGNGASRFAARISVQSANGPLCHPLLPRTIGVVCAIARNAAERKSRSQCKRD